ncbi:ATP-binding protein [Fodinibius sp.]|uniref:ATP-dependent nuclease n=1 Tax=Fodinibius sp. TaxID=1872440 RepID=UPI002ACEDD6A|nr:ATP-binding protein [Fodinibius sp.]MDZ7660483.1 ATP-binding protein [Fodinibius sp.]
MINFISINLEKNPQNSSDISSSGELVLSNDVTFIAGPNGSGKTQILKFLSNQFNSVNSLPVGTKFRFEKEDIDSKYDHIISSKVSEGHDYFGEVVDGNIINARISETSSNIVLPDWFKSNDGSIISRSSKESDELFELIGEARINQASGKVIKVNDSFNIPAAYFKIPHAKFLDAKRMRSISMDRHSTPQDFILNQNPSNTSPNELFSILETDPELEVEILARIEALTGVKIDIEKEGRQYSIKCSRTGRDGSWDYNSEADGIISLLVLLPYLYSEVFQIVFIDEPEAHLYPGLQQTLRTLIYDACEKTGKKVVLATHSEKIVAPPMTNFRDSVHVTIPHPNSHEVIQLRKAISNLGNDSSEIHQWLSEQAFGDNQDSVFSSLFASETIIVEGPFDMIFLDRVARFVGREFRAGSVAFLEAGGKGGVYRLVRLLKSMGRLTKVIVDSDVVEQPGVLLNIAREMGDSNEVIKQAINSDKSFDEIKALSRNFDIHILSQPGIEYYYHEEDNPQDLHHSSQKRISLIRELKSLEGLSFNEVRNKYSDLIAIIESAVHKMPLEWLKAHSRETNKLLAEILHEWRFFVNENGDDIEKLELKLKPLLQRFANHEFDQDKNLILTHRFLSAVNLKISIDDNPVMVNSKWIENFEI